MEDRNNRLRESLLRSLENGTLNGGDKLPGARRLAEDAGMTLPQVQMVLDSLVQCGVLETVPRNGTYVQQAWRTRVLPATFATYAPLSSFNAIERVLARELPGIHFCHGVPNAVFELRVTHLLLSRHDEYLDLMPLFRELLSDEETYFSRLVEPFVVDGKLCGVPIIFSPRLLLFNRDLFRKYGCPEPREDWSWDEFLAAVRLLKRHMPGALIFDWRELVHYWVNVVVRCGGCLLEPTAEDPVRIDSPATIRGLKLYAELREILWDGKNTWLHERLFAEEFARGNGAMTFAPRQFLHHMCRLDGSGFELGAVGIPMPEGGRRATMMAADLFCIRRECTDMRLARECMRLLFGDEIQNELGRVRYGIPLLKRAAMQSVDPENASDFRFISEIPHIVSEYNIFSPELYQLVLDGVADICLMPSGEVGAAAGRLADAVRLFLRISRRAGARRGDINLTQLRVSTR